MTSLYLVIPFYKEVKCFVECVGSDKFIWLLLFLICRKIFILKSIVRIIFLLYNYFIVNDKLTLNNQRRIFMSRCLYNSSFKNFIAFDKDGTYMVMFNPEIIKKSGTYDAEEGCLSLLGGPRRCKRYQNIKVQWQTAEFQTRIKTFTGFPAQIIQHEVDHCDGILI